MDEGAARRRASELAQERGLGPEYELAVFEKRIVLVRVSTDAAAPPDAPGKVRDVVAWVARFRTPRMRAEIAFDDATGEVVRWDSPKAGR